MAETAPFPASPEVPALDIERLLTNIQEASSGDDELDAFLELSRAMAAVLTEDQKQQLAVTLRPLYAKARAWAVASGGEDEDEHVEDPIEASAEVDDADEEE